MAVSEDLLGQIAVHLADELADQATAEELARLLGEDVLSWRAPEIAPQQIATILAFTFGNRMQPNGNRQPGPVNEALAEIALRLHRQTGAPIYAQWEVAEAIGARVPQEKLNTIFPARDERAEPIYLSTSAVIADIVRQSGNPRSLGNVAIVAFADHAWRCVTAARRLGLVASVPAGLPMPGEYDVLSGQPWCRSRLAYLLHDLAIRAAERRDALIAQAR